MERTGKSIIFYLNQDTLPAPTLPRVRDENLAADRRHETGTLYRQSPTTIRSPVCSRRRPGYRSDQFRFSELARLLHSLPGRGGYCLRNRLLFLLADSASPRHFATAQKHGRPPSIPTSNISNHRIGQTSNWPAPATGQPCGHPVIRYAGDGCRNPAINRDSGNYRQ